MSSIKTDQITIDIPEGMEEYAPWLRYFVQSMIIKLYINRHKGFGESVPYDDLERGLTKEFEEFMGARKEKSQYATLDECVDIANFGFLLGHRTLTLSRPEFEKDRG